MKKNIEFSVIIPVFNEELNINRLYKEIRRSLFNYQNYEIIIIDDCSTDNSRKIIIDLITGSKTVKYHFNEINLGKSRSIYNGIVKSKKYQYSWKVENTWYTKIYLSINFKNLISYKIFYQIQ